MFSNSVLTGAGADCGNSSVQLTPIATGQETILEAKTEMLKSTPQRANKPYADAEKLRIAFLVHDFPLASETFVINQAAGLRRRNHDLTIFSLYGKGKSGGARHEIVKELDLGRLGRYAPAGSVFIDRMNQAGSAKSFVTSLSRRAMRAGAFLSEASLFARQGSFDIVHCQFGSLGLPALRHSQCGMLRFKKLVVHLRGYDVSAFVREKGIDVYQKLFERGDLFIANCEFFRQRAISLGCPPEKVTVIGSGLDIEQFPAKIYEPAVKRPIRLVTIGRLTEKKGLSFAIEGVAKLIRDGADVVFDIIGEGPLRPDLQAQINELDVASRVRLLGEKNHDEISAILRKRDIMIAASVTSSSGDQDAPVNTLKEAMASGLPVVATRHGGIPELVQDGVSGYLVPEKDADALCAALAQLIGEPQKWPDMGREGRRKVLEDYDQEIVTDRIISAYQQLLNEKDNRQ